MVETIILFDTEYTAWEGSQRRQWSEPWEHREVIQIAAAKVDLLSGLSEIAVFNRYIKPQRNPALSTYISDLTGITQATIDEQGVPFVDAFQDFFNFCEQGRYPLFSWGDDPSVLRENCDLTGLSFAGYGLDFHDIRWVFEQVGIDTRCYSSGTVYTALNIPLVLSSHNAMNDVRSLQVTLAKLSREQLLPANWLVNGKFPR